MKEERHIVSTEDHNLLKEAEVTKAIIEPKLEAQKAADKKNSEPWYFSHC